MTIQTRPELHAVKTLDNSKSARPCDPMVIRDQIGMLTILAVAGTPRRVYPIKNTDHEPCGIIIWCGRQRLVEVVLDWDDTYSVRRYRVVVNGTNKGELVEETHQYGIYCENISDAVYTASCWQ